MSDAKEGPVRDRSGRISLSLEDELVGAWSLVSYTLTDEGGGVAHPLGEGAHGLLLFSPDGYVSTQIGGGAQASGTEDGAAGGRDLAYAGRWAVDGERLTYRLDVSVLPAGHDVATEHGVELHGDALTLSAGDVVVGDRTSTAHLVWRRAAAQDADGTADGGTGAAGGES
ncbi:lipocalin-like domain-containing protein [Georgenia wangjunii]|uniref:lipocalin-like domain-containing protein n=1 Tax=Georgenia wangjunii TaxID=3117730 RepID=UPI002F265679